VRVIEGMMGRGDNRAVRHYRFSAQPDPLQTTLVRVATHQYERGSPMQRRDFIKSMVAGGAIAAVGHRAHAVPQGWREFEITYVITLKDATAPAQLWVPVPQDALSRREARDE
jgi:hypothetical protein